MLSTLGYGQKKAHFRYMRIMCLVVSMMLMLSKTLWAQQLSKEHLVDHKPIIPHNKKVLISEFPVNTRGVVFLNAKDPTLAEIQLRDA